MTPITASKTRKMQMSLEDIIKQSKSTRPRTGGTGPRRGGGPSRGGPGGPRPAAGAMRGRSSSGSGFDGRYLPNYEWEAFLESRMPRQYGSSDTTKLIVTNLHGGVTTADIVELFSDIGPLRSAQVQYDWSGRPLGTADLIFERRIDAIKAMKQYHGVPLDGYQMNIQLAVSEIPGGRDLYRSSGDPRFGSSGGFKRGPSSRSSDRSSRPRRGLSGRSRGAGGKPGDRQPKKPPTAEQLDAELEEYVKSRVPNSKGA